MSVIYALIFKESNAHVSRVVDGVPKAKHTSSLVRSGLVPPRVEVFYWLLVWEGVHSEQSNERCLWRQFQICLCALWKVRGKNQPSYLWAVWKERNSRTFRGASTSVEGILHIVVLRIAKWASLRNDSIV